MRPEEYDKVGARPQWLGLMSGATERLLALRTGDEPLTLMDVIELFLTFEESRFYVGEENLPKMSEFGMWLAGNRNDHTFEHAEPAKVTW